MRILLTYPDMHHVLSAEKALRNAKQSHFKFRPTPTPANLSSDICGIAIELLDEKQEEEILNYLHGENQMPTKVHKV